MIEQAICFIWYGIIIWMVIHTITHWEEISEQAKKTRAENRKISEQARDLYKNKEFCKDMEKWGKEYTKKIIEENRKTLGG